MSLIKCPKCGKDVSDSAVKCVHCGCDLAAIKQQEQKEKEYSLLPATEKKRLRDEYDKLCPDYLKQENYLRKLSLGMLIVAIPLIIFFVLGVVLHYLHKFGVGNLSVYVALVPLGLAALLLVVGVILYFILLSGRKKELYEQKKFVVWLEKEKGLTYTFVLSQKDREIYNSYKID